MSGILWGLLGALLIGTSDCIARVTARQVSMAVLFLFIMGLSTVVLSVWLLLNQQMPAWHAYGWATSAVSGVLNIVALYFLYLALARGPVSVASPTASTFSLLLIGLNVLAGEPWTGLQLVAALVVFTGVIMLAQRDTGSGIDDDYDARWLRTTMLYALACAMTISLRMFLAQEAATTLGPLTALYLNRLFALLTTLVLLTVLLLRGQSLRWPTERRLAWLVGLQAVFETLALGSFLAGSAGSGRVGAAIGFSAFAAATTLLARIWLGEKVGLRRWFWIGLIGGGIMLAVLGT